MRRWYDLTEVSGHDGPSVVTVGVFDGVHRGHQWVLEQTRQRADVAKARAVVLTFDPHPASVVRPDLVPPALSTVSRRLELFEGYGMDAAVVLPFTQARSQQPAEEFVREVVGALRPVAFVVGDDFRFGYKAAGDLGLLERLGAELDFAVTGLPRGEHAAWSSSAVRDRLEHGDVASAAEILGHAHRVEGIVVRGDQRGRELGIPTANVPVEPGLATPADGVYAGWLIPRTTASDTALPTVISIGTKPQFGEHERVIEAHVLDRFDLQLYDVPVAIDFVDWIRGQATFGSVEELIEQERRDIERTRSALAAA